MITIKDKFQSAKAGSTTAPKDHESMFTARIDFPSDNHAGAIHIFGSPKEHAEEMRDTILKFMRGSADLESWREEYRKKQAAGVRFQIKDFSGEWVYAVNYFDFSDEKEKYREVPHVEESKPTIHHLAERKLWLAQREAGTNEIWQYKSPLIKNDEWDDLIDDEPGWDEDFLYRPKPKTVKRYMAMLKNGKGASYAFSHSSREEIEAHARQWDITIIGNIEEREVEV